ncbi:MAG: phosphoribosyltransferase family protein [Dehalococcoidia bacterium]
MPPLEGAENLWLAKALFDLGGIQFGSFTLPRGTIESPVYVDPRVLISEPEVLRRTAAVIAHETASGSLRRRPRVSPFTLVAGVPFGGLHLATAYSLMSGTPMIYPRPPRTGGMGDIIEGRYQEGQTVLIIDDLITHGSSILQTKSLLEEAGLRVRDAVILVDREAGGSERLRRHGVNLVAILKLKTVLNHLRALELVSSEDFERSMTYLEGKHPDEPTSDYTGLPS